MENENFWSKNATFEHQEMLTEYLDTQIENIREQLSNIENEMSLFVGNSQGPTGERVSEYGGKLKIHLEALQRKFGETIENPLYKEDLEQYTKLSKNIQKTVIDLVQKREFTGSQVEEWDKHKEILFEIIPRLKEEALRTLASLN